MADEIASGSGIRGTSGPWPGSATNDYRGDDEIISIGSALYKGKSQWSSSHPQTLTYSVVSLNRNLFTFAGWEFSGCVPSGLSGGGETCTATEPDEITTQGVVNGRLCFTRNEFPVTVNKTGSGNVESNRATVKYYGTAIGKDMIQFTITPDAGFGIYSIEVCYGARNSDGTPKVITYGKNDEEYDYKILYPTTQKVLQNDFCSGGASLTESFNPAPVYVKVVFKQYYEFMEGEVDVDFRGSSFTTTEEENYFTGDGSNRAYVKMKLHPTKIGLAYTKYDQAYAVRYRIVKCDHWGEDEESYDSGPVAMEFDDRDMSHEEAQNPITFEWYESGGEMSDCMRSVSLTVIPTVSERAFTANNNYSDVGSVWNYVFSGPGSTSDPKETYWFHHTDQADPTNYKFRYVEFGTGSTGGEKYYGTNGYERGASGETGSYTRATAVYGKRVDITSKVVPEDCGGTVTRKAERAFEGDYFWLKAVDSDLYHFKVWKKGGEEVGDSRTLSFSEVKMDDAGEYTAEFSKSTGHLMYDPDNGKLIYRTKEEP